eukprot:gene36703-59852_t
MAIIYAMERKLQAMQKATLVLILLFGTLTLALHDDRFIKWKPTVLYGAMALALAVALWALKKNFLKMLLGQQLELPERIWGRLNVAWIGYCLFMAIINGLGQLQALGLCVPHRLPGGAGPVHRAAPEERRQADGMTSTTTATTAAPLPTAAALEAALREALAPTQLEVIDESAAHAGHAGANAEGR